MGTPRIVKPRLNKDIGLRGKGWSSRTKVPGILHANSEARHEGLKIYEIFLPLEQKGVTVNQGRVFFNPLIDTLYLDQHALETSRGPWQPDAKSLAKVQHIAVPIRNWREDTINYGGSGSTAFDLNSLQKYQQLQTLTLVRDFTDAKHPKRNTYLGPIHLRQCLTDERKILLKVRETLESMAEKDLTTFKNACVQNEIAVDAGAKPALPILQYGLTPAVRVMEYVTEGALYGNGAMGFDDSGKWKGYGWGKFMRLSKGWEWIIPKQWLPAASEEDEQPEIPEDRKLALQCVDGWKH